MRKVTVPSKLVFTRLVAGVTLVLGVHGSVQLEGKEASEDPAERQRVNQQLAEVDQRAAALDQKINRLAAQSSTLLA